MSEYKVRALQWQGNNLIALDAFLEDRINYIEVAGNGLILEMRSHELEINFARVMPDDYILLGKNELGGNVIIMNEKEFNSYFKK